MATVFIPSQMRDLTAGEDRAEVTGTNLRQLVQGLESKFPGLRERLISEDRLAPGLTVSVDGNISNRGLLTPVKEGSEVHFLPVVGAG